MEDPRQTPPAKITFSNPHSSSDEENHRSPTTNHRQSRSKATGRPRGRPAGSKNKPKPPIFITRDTPNSLRSHVMEIPPAHDIIEVLADFAAKRQRGIWILSATGSVMNIALRQPSPPHQLSPTMAKPGSLNFSGKFEILSISGAFMPPPAPPCASGVTVLVGGGQGQVLGGKVMGPLLTAGLVVIMASSFANTSYERLPLLEDDLGENEEEEKVTLTLPGTGEKVETLYRQDTMDHHHHHREEEEQLMSLIPTTTSATATSLLHGFDVMPAEEFWGGAPHERPAF